MCSELCDRGERNHQILPWSLLFFMILLYIVGLFQRLEPTLVICDGVLKYGVGQLGPAEPIMC